MASIDPANLAAALASMRPALSHVPGRRMQLLAGTAPTVLDVKAPTLIRAESFGTVASAGAPTNDFGTNRLWAQFGNYAQDEGLGVSCQGPFVYLPREGRWYLFWYNDPGVSPATVCNVSVFEGVTIAEAKMALQSISSIETINFTTAVVTARTPIGRGDAMINGVLVPFAKLARLCSVWAKGESGGPRLSFGAPNGTNDFQIQVGAVPPSVFDPYSVCMAAPYIRTLAAGNLTIICAYR